MPEAAARRAVGFRASLHNYPREMDFYLGDPEVDRLVAYIMTLKDPNYRRPPD